MTTHQMMLPQINLHARVHVDCMQSMDINPFNNFTTHVTYLEKLPLVQGMDINLKSLQQMPQQIHEFRYQFDEF
jgi:hypothetical protein